MHTSLVDQVAGYSERQEGAVSLRQLSKAGLDDRVRAAWIESGRLVPTLVSNVFRMPGAPVTWKQDLWIAVLAGPRLTVVSHASAGALRGLLAPPASPHVTVPRTASGRFRGAVVHHAAVEAADRCRFEGLPCTGVGRTIVDCAPLLDRDAFDALVDAALGRNLSTYRKVKAAWDRAGPVRGGAVLRAALRPYTGNPTLHSEKEAHLMRRFEQWGIPLPECQYVIRDHRGRFVAQIDFGWPEWRFGLEYLGDEYHSPRRWGHDDRRLERAAATLGWRFEESDRGDFRPSATRLPKLLRAVLSPSALGPAA